MSQFNVNEIFDKDGNDGAVLHGVASAPGSMGFRNRIINGDMRIDQRNAGASVTPTTDATYTLDRWQAWLNNASKYSVQQNAGSVTPPAGFTNYLGVTSLAATSVGASDYYALAQSIEGFNVANLNWGTANAATVTVSFWVRSSLTGTFGGSLRNAAANRSYPYSYTISAANTWEYKTITITGDTTGTWLTNNGVGVTLWFSLGVGSNYSGTAGAWNSNNNTTVTGSTSVVGTNGATWYITGVQLEVGSVATPFERLDYGRQLIQCQRYYQRQFPIRGCGVGNGASDVGRIKSPLGTTMRASPTATLVGTLTTFDSGVGTITALGSVWTTPDLLEFDATLASGSTASGRCVVIYNNASANTGALSSGGVTLSAEL